MHDEIMQLRIKRMRELGKPENETVHCLVCEFTYPENVMPPIVKACPHCGNSDKNQTVYLSKEQDA